MQDTANPPVLEDKTLMLFEGNLKRIFALSITRSTFRELQNVILACSNNNQPVANFLFETLLTGQIKGSIPNEKHREILEDCIKFFTIPARLAKEVYERGEFINIVTSDLISQGDESAFLNIVRRIDGEEFRFLSDPSNTVNLVQHFIGRLQELEKNPKAKEKLSQHKNDLKVLGERLKQLAI